MNSKSKSNLMKGEEDGCMISENIIKIVGEGPINPNRRFRKEVNNPMNKKS